MKTSPRRGATAIELLVLGTLATFAIGLTVPAIQKARAASARTKCADNLRLLGTGSREYAAANDDMLPRNSGPTPAGSWNTQILPFIGEKELAQKYTDGRDWWDAGENGNRTVAQGRVAAFVCPAAPNPDRWVLTRDPDNESKSFRAAPTDYVGAAGAYYENNDQKNLHPGAMHTRTVTRRLRTSDIADGTAQTVLVVEMADKPNHWHAGKLGENRLEKPQMTALSGQWAAPNWNHLRSHSTDGKTQFGPCAVNCSNQAAIYGFHEGGANVLFVDGSVRFLKAGMSQEMLIALVSIAGGEVLAPNDF
ncbi:Uncharacterized protein OS=Planctomyces limnophilus (strain ATCC 43296 / DSM 3776 / IFAM 1008 / 290) GN=Plim_0027 PE=4 SV=1: SBP_bac_10 [Gemmata massiliana]|uniref:DUF1559 domain-containing protein n=1 Tax=Gemmata massiliana TaxID=1210884 RepID=A0A6P2CTB7_9BACT|nr:DUF1559 domain-containing protein [Gemmata massiliana]VTR92388.1 Uncharacterized protein OS=Planctomyces limnophilus (strain ATCC 43296 / DSM 3776 / IFAM 1008 / 290) GN=Plim_0027 PE=4 SV=1: SBP_bac_10 [Gemmata massiliana]